MDSFFQNLKKEKFLTPSEMLKYLYQGTDFYNPETGDYVFEYSESGSLAVYHGISENFARALANKDKETGEQYWGAHLGYGGEILEGESVFNYIKDAYNSPNWIATAVIDRAVAKDDFDTLTVKKGITFDMLLLAKSKGILSIKSPSDSETDLVYFIGNNRHTVIPVNFPGNGDSRDNLKTIYRTLYTFEVSLDTFKDVLKVLAEAGIDIDLNHYGNKYLAATDLQNEKKPTKVTLGEDMIQAIMYDCEHFFAEECLFESAEKTVRNFYNALGCSDTSYNYDTSERAGFIRDYIKSRFTKDTGINLISIGDCLDEEKRRGLDLDGIPYERSEDYEDIER